MSVSPIRSPEKDSADTTRRFNPHQTGAQWKTVEKSKCLSSYKPISNYGIIGDLKTCALIGIDGSIDWFCAPRFDSPSVFGAMLDRKLGGRFQIAPAAETFQASQSYEPLTNILVTEFSLDTGKVRLADFMPCFKFAQSTVSAGEIHRILECKSGTMDIELRLEPRFNYGSITPDISLVKGSGYLLSCPNPEIRQGISFLTDLEFQEPEKGTLSTRIKMKRRDRLEFVLRSGRARVEQYNSKFSSIKLRETRNFWKRWAQKCKYEGKWKAEVLRSALALKLLQYSPTGAIIAAATTSLPEEIGGSRNWDYRFSWIRDSSFVLWAFHALGHNEEAASYTNWLMTIFYLTSGSPQIMLGINGERDLSEQTLQHLEGYMKSSPVRIGNGAWNQSQLDVFGILLDALYFTHKHGGGIEKKQYDYLIKPIMNSMQEAWKKPDSGIWEVRSEQQHFVYSKMWCWVAADRAAKIANALGKVEDSTEWNKLKDTIKEEVYSKGFDESVGSFVRSYGSKSVDSANLLMPQVRFISAKDPKMIATMDVTMKKLLVENKFLYRYLDHDGVSGKEGAFLICSFWLVTCLTMAGRLDEAERLMDSLITYSNHLGLFSEEIDPQTGTLLGNFPQAFTHMGFITAATALGRAISERDQNRSETTNAPLNA